MAAPTDARAAIDRQKYATRESIAPRYDDLVKRTPLTLALWAGVAGAPMTIEVMDARDADAFRKEGFKVKTPKPDAPTAWPSYAQRVWLLNLIPELGTFAKKSSWDDYALDEFIAATRAPEATETKVAGLYPKVPKPLLQQTFKAARAI